MDEFGVNQTDPRPQRFRGRRAPFFTEQRILTALGLLAVLGIIVGATKLMGEIRSPFATQLAVSESLSAAAKLNEKLSGLSEKDTDGDGLNDFQELYQLGTSPYLADSDSDGIADLQEVEEGTNPNCPTGENCSSFLTEERESGTTQETQKLTNTLSLTEEVNTVTVDALRETLKNSGAPQYILDATSDQEILNLYQEVAGSAGLPTGDGSTLGSLEDLKGFTAAEIRELLISSGADASVLRDVSDEDLKEIFNQALKEELSVQQ